MKNLRRAPVAACPTALILIAVLCMGITLSEVAGQAQSNQSSASHTHKLSSDLAGRISGAKSGADRLDCILQLNAKPSGRLNALLNRNGVRLRAHFSAFNSYAIDLPASAVAELASFGEVEYVSLNSRVESFGHISTTTGADAVRSIAGTTTSGLDGTGIGIAILDSGIDSSHKSFLDKNNGLRVAFSRDFTGENRTDDP
ncbi:MAG TPA: hypothetical protein VF553_21495, partial [Pyrinomonadaceae bacterium]